MEKITIILEKLKESVEREFMNFESKMLSEGSQTQKATRCMILCTNI